MVHRPDECGLASNDDPVAGTSDAVLPVDARYDRALGLYNILQSSSLLIYLEGK
jgi:hypothetical protein